jgi:putative transposase
MKRSRFADEQIAYALRQVDGGTAVADVCREIAISEATLYLWKKKYANLGSTEIRELFRKSPRQEQRVPMDAPAIALTKQGPVTFVTIGSLALLVVALVVYGVMREVERTFYDPMYRGERLDIRFTYANDCGLRAATRWCRVERKFREAVDFDVDSNIGARGIKTKTIGGDQICSGDWCTGYKQIVCKR